MKKLFLLILFLALAGISELKAQIITVGDLNYTVNSNPLYVTVTGHVDGQNAAGELVIPSSIEYDEYFYEVADIGEGAFENCSGFTGSLVLPNTIRRIHGDAFRGCSGFDGTLEIGERVYLIENDAFRDCSGFTEALSYARNAPQLSGPCFDNFGCSTLTVLCGYKKVYENADYWLGEGGFSSIETDCDYFAAQGAEWYYHVRSSWPMIYPDYHIVMSVDGETEVLGHACKIVDGNYIYEDNGMVYCYNQYNDVFTVLYDFNAQVGDTWNYDVDSCSYVVTVMNVGDVTWEGHTYRTQTVSAISDNNGYINVFSGQIIDGIGFEQGLFPNHGLVNDTDPISYLRCYLIDGEKLYHEGSINCDAITIDYWDGTAADAYDGGDGSPENPYRIATEEQLALLAQQTNDGTGGDAYYILDGWEINLQSVTAGRIPWVSIGTPEHPFTGHFDGQDQIVRNMYQNVDGIENTVGGLFGCTYGAEIKNIRTTYCTVEGNGAFVGTLVGYAGLTDIFDCSDTNSNVITTDGVAGGLVGYAGQPYGTSITTDETFSISDCRFTYTTVTGATAGGVVGQVNGLGPTAMYRISDCVFNNGFYSFDITGQSKAGGIVGCLVDGIIDKCINENCVYATGENSVCGGIVGEMENSCIRRCGNFGAVSGITAVGGISGGGTGLIKNCYNIGNVTTAVEQSEDGMTIYVGGISAGPGSIIRNVYNSGVLNIPDLSQIPDATLFAGNIVGYETSDDLSLNCYWLDDDEFPACGNSDFPNIQASSQFHRTDTPYVWSLNEPQYDTDNLVEALNIGSDNECLWKNGIYHEELPIIADIYPLLGGEWYYQIINGVGNVSFQHLAYQSDTTINHRKIKVIVKTNTLYDKDSEVSNEYIYEEDGKVFWWNQTLEEFTVLYDFTAEAGDEWQIKVNEDVITIHVDAVGTVEYEGNVFKSLTVSDENNIFSGTILCSIGHLTSFFPEKLLKNKSDFYVNGIRCFWNGTDLIYKEGDVDCDAIYNEWHVGIDEIAENGFTIYPNPTNDVLFVLSESINSEYRITNTIGQTIMTGNITSDNQMIDVSSLPKGIYFITLTNKTTIYDVSTQKFVIK